MKEANLKKLHTAWFQLDDILEKANVQRQLKYQELGVDWIGETDFFSVVEWFCMIV